MRSLLRLARLLNKSLCDSVVDYGRVVFLKYFSGDVRGAASIPPRHTCIFSSPLCFPRSLAVLPCPCSALSALHWRSPSLAAPAGVGQHLVDRRGGSCAAVLHKIAEISVAQVGVTRR